MPVGFSICLYIVILVTVMDVFAYIGGNVLGKIKIVPNISKGKTVEGTLIGLIVTIITSVFVKEIVNLDTYQAVFIGGLIGIMAFFGDLIISLLKRKNHVKDSGNIIPGHGGLLDRCDGYILILPILGIFYF